MAFDPQREDYQRLGLRFARTLDGGDATAAAHAFSSFGLRFQQDRDSLPQTDEDRAFHLVTLAAADIDYRLPFADEREAEKLVAHGHQLLKEALALDAGCFDAARMQAASEKPSFDGYLAYLVEGEPEVRARCLAERDRALEGPDSPERARLAADLACAPYLRWLAAEAEEALICGRNREALRVCREALELDPHDQADVRFTETLALAKLEDEAGLDAACARRQPHGRRTPADDAWTRLARLALAYKAHEMDRARDELRGLVETYPNAAESLIRQAELPDGVFARLCVLPYSEDELILALSEGTVLLQEGRDPRGAGALSAWVARETSKLAPRASSAVMRERMAESAAGADGWQGPDANLPRGGRP